MKKSYFAVFFSTILLLAACLLLNGCGGETPPPEKTYTVSFYVDGACVKTVESKGNEEIAFPEDPSKPGYAFIGWGCTFSNGYTETYFTPGYYKTISLTENCDIFLWTLFI